MPDRGGLVWVSFNPQKGHEQAGRRPALIISPAAYNGVSNCILGPVDVHLSQRIVAASDMKAAKLVSVLQ